jgi:hypothetical protein
LQLQGLLVVPLSGRAVIPDEGRVVVPRFGRCVVQSQPAGRTARDSPRKIRAACCLSRVNSGTIFGGTMTTCGGTGMAA